MTAHVPGPVPVSVTGSGGTMYRWLGAFWNEIADGRGDVRMLQAAYGLLDADRWRRYRDAIDLGAGAGPAFRRTRLLPVVLRAGDRNRCGYTAVAARPDRPLAAGDSQSAAWEEGTLPVAGGYAVPSGVAAYPLAGTAPARYGVCVDNPFRPSFAFAPDVDFSLVDGSIVFFGGVDPLGAAESATVWVCDVESEAGFVSDFHAGELGLAEPASSDEYRAFATAAVALAARGPSRALFESAVAAMLGVPYAEEDGVVAQVYAADIELGGVLYHLPDGCVPAVEQGDEVSRGEPFAAGLQFLYEPETALDTLTSFTPALVLAMLWFRLKDLL